MKKTYLTPTAETVKVQKRLMQSSNRVTNAATNLTGEDNIVLGGSSANYSGGARSDFFGGTVWDDTDYEE